MNADAKTKSDNFFKRHNALKRRGAFGLYAYFAISQFGDTVHNTYRERTIAMRAYTLMLFCLFRLHAHIARSMPVNVIAPLFRKKFDGARERQRRFCFRIHPFSQSADEIVVTRALPFKHVRFSPEM